MAKAGVDTKPTPERRDSADLSGRLPNRLEQRLELLPEGHPSEADYSAPDAPPDPETVGDRNRAEAAIAAGKERADRRITELTDAEHEAHVTEVRDRLDDARGAGLATNLQHTTDARHRVWGPDRAQLHDEIINEIYREAAAVPCEGKAILAGGLPGAGKTTVLTGQAGIDLARYLVLDPDRIKEALAARNMIPEVEGLSPMEASDLVHAESSYIAKRLARQAYSDRKNVIWDITMSSSHSTSTRIDDLRNAGYGRVQGIFVDIPVEISKQRADARHREGHELYRAGQGLGGRYLLPSVIDAQADPDWGSKNRAAFEEVKHRFDAWSRYDNSVAHQPARLVESSEPGNHELRRTTR